MAEEGETLEAGVPVAEREMFLGWKIFQNFVQRSVRAQSEQKYSVSKQGKIVNIK